MNFYVFFFFSPIFENFESGNINPLLHSSPKGIRWSGGSIQLDFFVHFFTSNSVAKKPPVIWGIDCGMNCVGHVNLDQLLKNSI